MLHRETLFAQAGTSPDEATGAVVPPIHLATTYERDADGAYSRGFFYSRIDNPTRRRFEETLAQLEGGTECAAFSSGMAASMAVLQALRPGDHVVLPEDVYYGVRRVVHDLFRDWGLKFTAVDMTDLGAFEAALRPETRLVWAETPSNPMLKITDLEAVAGLTHAAGATLVVDATWTPSLIQRSFDLGADLVVHSVTKYIGGHSDVLGGAVITRKDSDLFKRIRFVQTAGGAVMDPFSAWLSLRGVRTLAARLHMQCESAGVLARFLAGHPRVRVVHYPGLPSHPGHEIASKQMKDFGGMLSFEVAGGREEAIAVVGRCRVFTRATSLGGTESLIEHRASSEPQPTRTPEALIRVSVGLEHADDLVADLSQALGD